MEAEDCVMGSSSAAKWTNCSLTLEGRSQTIKQNSDGSEYQGELLALLSVMKSQPNKWFSFSQILPPSPL
jgi:hypothetical protein